MSTYHREFKKKIWNPRKIKKKIQKKISRVQKFRKKILGKQVYVRHLRARAGFNGFLLNVAFCKLLAL